MAPKLKKLGWSDLMVSEACIGTMTFGSQNTEVQAHEILDAAFAAGINFIDTAEVYPTPPNPETVGRTEEYIGTWLEKQDRKKVILATKVCGYSKNSHTPGNRSNPPSKEKMDARVDTANIEAAIAGSLRRLRTDYVDLYQLHWPDRYVPLFGQSVYDVKLERPSVPFEETVGAMGKLIKEGKVRYWGVCNETPYGVCELVRAADKLGVPRPITIQNQFNLLHRSFETSLAELAAPSHYNMALLPWSPLGQGVLTGKYLGGARPEGARLAESKIPVYQMYLEDKVGQLVAQYVDLAKELDITPAQLALAWVNSRWFVGSTIIGATKTTHLKENLDAFEIELSEDVLKKIDFIHLQCKDPYTFI
ncbi:aldo keto reductase [Klebsormidium nitens]|uniref:Aldo keto reductase n=1 Tax=Klebsormidium nitens TaxID=105231 RepID=A0A1Y1IG85_KLENI|nr:aldo keto reductase [Klebsormidium nitens]|eukprot:GAQ87118.1 aldo keto reductase [Klebsormidium nitens]